MPIIPQILVFSLSMHFSRIRSKLLALLQLGGNTLCTRANAVAGVVQLHATPVTDMENLDEMAVFCAFGNKKRTKVPNKEDCRDECTTEASESPNPLPQTH